jgi:tRNA(Arg) A34 adenosine deaminase TadA
MGDEGDRISFSLPAWLADFTRDVGRLVDEAERMRLVIQAGARNVAEGAGGPFAAAVFESASGRLVALGVNLVVSQGLSTLHAEMVAIMAAQRRLGVWDLGGPGLPDHELVVSAEPCAMCFGAIFWSGVRRIVTGATEADARAIGFDEGPKAPDWRRALEARGIAVRSEVLRAEARAVLDDYARRGGVIYNSRG